MLFVHISNFSDGIEDPYLDTGSIVQTMEMMATISRFDLASAHDLLLSHFDSNIAIIQNVVASKKKRQS